MRRLKIPTRKPHEAAPRLYRENNNNWKGGVIKNNGYAYIRIGGHYFLRVNQIAKKILDRRLKKGEMVHHINEITDDDRNCNLLICTRGYHKWLHHKMKKLRQGRISQGSN